MELAVKRMFLGMLNSGVQAVRGGPEDRRPMTVDREEEEAAVRKGEVTSR